MSEHRHGEALFRALRFIQNNLEEEIGLDDIAAAAYISPFHFHRLFKDFTGETVKSYLRRLRLENAAFRLRARDEKIVDLAFDSGFYTHETFTRAFNKRFGRNPSSYKSLDPFEFSDDHIDHIGKVWFRERHCIFKRYIGPYELSGTPADRDSPWHQLAGYLPKSYREFDTLELYGISHDDPGITEQKNIRYDACIAIPEEVQLGETALKIPEGTYIVARHKGPFEDLTKSYYYIIYHWLKLYNLQIDHRISPFEQFKLSSLPRNTEIESINIHIPI